MTCAYRFIVPSLSILAEPPVTIVDKGKTHGSEGQEIGAKNYYRPTLESMANSTKRSSPRSTITIDDVFRRLDQGAEDRFADGGVFDQIYAR